MPISKPWETNLQVLHLVESNNLTSTAEVQEKLGLPDMILRTSIGPVSADPEGFLIDSVDATYRSTVRATPDTGGVTRVQVWRVLMQFCRKVPGPFLPGFIGSFSSAPSPPHAHPTRHLPAIQLCVACTIQGVAYGR